MIDVEAEPLIHEIIELPETSNEDYKLSYEVAAGTKPYLEIEHYKHSYKNRPEDRKIGVFNYFKGRRELAVTDTKNRLMRMHSTLKTTWYLQAAEHCL